MINLALRSALSDRASEGRVIVVDEWTFRAPKTKEGVKVLDALGVSDRILVVIDATVEADIIAAKSFANIPSVQIIEAGELNAYDVLCNDYVVFTKATLPGVSA